MLFPVGDDGHFLLDWQSMYLFVVLLYAGADFRMDQVILGRSWLASLVDQTNFESEVLFACFWLFRRRICVDNSFVSMCLHETLVLIPFLHYL